MLESSIGEKLKSNNVPAANRISPANVLNISDATKFIPLVDAEGKVVLNEIKLKRIIKESLFEFFSEKYEDTLKIYESLKPIG